jgi:hypothetical protein
MPTVEPSISVTKVRVRDPRFVLNDSPGATLGLNSHKDSLTE